jgi:enamine deaminase RidA (YjgF/YER057c/UK114 family)
MLKIRNPPAIAAPAALYSHSVEIPPNAHWLFTAGQVGVRPDGFIPEGFEAQHDQIRMNTLALLADSDMGLEDIVRLNVYLRCALRAGAWPAAIALSCVAPSRGASRPFGFDRMARRECAMLEPLIR